MDALVIGGGIAGCAAALALTRAGLAVEVHEAHAEAAPGAGLFLTVGSNGVAALRTLGCGAAVRAAGIPTERLRLRSGTGRVLGTMPHGTPAADGSGSVTIGRADLLDALRAAVAEAGIPVRLGRRLEGLDEADDRVTARFTDGTDATADLLVGADGTHSRTRGLIDAAAPAPRPGPVLNVGGCAPGVRLDVEPGTMDMAFGRRVFVGWIQGPDGIWWFANPPRDATPPGADPRRLDWRDTLTALVAGDRTPATELVAATPGPLRAWPTYDLPRVPTWRTATTVLVGDAAHAVAPSSGQGASLAVEDALDLARCVRDVADLPAALATYERLRRRRVERVVAWGARTSSSKVAGPVGAALRDLLAPLAMPLLARRRDDWLFGYPVTWERPVATTR